MNINGKHMHYLLIISWALLASACVHRPQMSLHEVDALGARMESLQPGMVHSQVLDALGADLRKYVIRGDGPNTHYAITYDLRPGYVLRIVGDATADWKIGEVWLNTPTKSYSRILLPPAAVTARAAFSVDETVAFARKGQVGLEPLDFYWNVKRSNGGALPALRQMLQDDSHPEYWQGAIAILGGIGQEQDTAALTHFIQARAGPKESDRVLGALQALAVMASRNISGAQTTLDAMMSPAYWADAGFTANDSSTDPGFTTIAAGDAMTASAYSGNDHLQEKFAAVISKVKDPRSAAYLQNRADSAVRAEKTWRVSKANFEAQTPIVALP